MTDFHIIQQQTSMGASNTKSVSEELKINDEQWQYRTNERNQQIVRHRFKDLQGEVALIAADPLHTIQDELDIYNFRKHQEKALVEVYCAEYLKSTHATMCGNQLNIKVIHQRIPQRLRDLPFLTFSQAVYVLSQSLRGFQECYDKVGPFEVTDRMIGINNKGTVKVWLNEEYAQNHPTSQRPSLQIIVSYSHRNSASQQQSFFVRNIIEIIRSKVQNKKFPAQFEKRLKQTNGFVETYCQIERYCQQMKIWVPDRIITNSSSIRTENNHIQSTVRKMGNMVNESHATYVPYVYPISSRDTYVTPNYESRTDFQTYTPNGKKNIPPLFRSAQRPPYPYTTENQNIPQVNNQGTFMRSGYTYNAI